HLSATNADAQLVTLHEQDNELGQVFLKIRKQTGFNFLFNTQILQLAHPVTVSIEKLPLDKALDAIFEEQPLTYSIIDRTIVIKVAAYKTETMNTLSSPVLEDYLLEQNHDYMAIVEGIVTDPSGEPLIGVNIQVKGTTRGSTTNFEGMYSIEAELQDTLVLSYIGYHRLVVPINGQVHIDVIMESELTELEELVVVGYGVQKKGNLTGSVTNVNVKALESRPSADLGRGLQGLVPGLSVRIPSGEVGSDPLMRIRGFIGSIQGSSQPLILVDNVEIPSIQMINPNDVESITVLKDAASSSIYGSKAAFGVILITT